MDLIGRESTFEKESKDKSPKTRSIRAGNREAHYDDRSLNRGSHSLEHRCEAGNGKGSLWREVDRMDAKPEDKKVIPHMEPISYLSDANKIAWVRAFLGWAYKAVMIQEVDPQVDMCEHTGMVHFLLEINVYA